MLYPWVVVSSLEYSWDFILLQVLSKKFKALWKKDNRYSGIKDVNTIQELYPSLYAACLRVPHPGALRYFKGELKEREFLVLQKKSSGSYLVVVLFV